jgi:hypothetical protein
LRGSSRAMTSDGGLHTLANTATLHPRRFATEAATLRECGVETAGRPEVAGDPSPPADPSPSRSEEYKGFGRRAGVPPSRHPGGCGESRRHAEATMTSSWAPARTALRRRTRCASAPRNCGHPAGQSGQALTGRDVCHSGSPYRSAFQVKTEVSTRCASRHLPMERTLPEKCPLSVSR